MPCTRTMGRMIPRSDVGAMSASGFPPDADRDVLAINGHHFELGLPGMAGLVEPA